MREPTRYLITSNEMVCPNYPSCDCKGHFVFEEINQPNYKQLWFDLSEEKKELQLENHRLKNDSERYRKECAKFERMYNQEKVVKNE